MAIIRGVGWLTSPQVGRILDALGDLYILGYIFLAFRTAYGGTRWKSARDTIFVSMVYMLALMTGTAAIVATTMLGRRWLQALGF